MLQATTWSSMVPTMWMPEVTFSMRPAAAEAHLLSWAWQHCLPAPAPDAWPTDGQGPPLLPLQPPGPCHKLWGLAVQMPSATQASAALPCTGSGLRVLMHCTFQTAGLALEVTFSIEATPVSLCSYAHGRVGMSLCGPVSHMLLRKQVPG